MIRWAQPRRVWRGAGGAVISVAVRWGGLVAHVSIKGTSTVQVVGPRSRVARDPVLSGRRTRFCVGVPTFRAATGILAAVKRPITVFLLDDHEIVRRGVADLLNAEDDIKVIGEAATQEEAVGRVHALDPDVAVLDVRLEHGNGIEACRDIRSLHPRTACLILTSYADDEALFHAIMAGAAGYVLKQIRSDRPRRRRTPRRRRGEPPRPGRHREGARTDPQRPPAGRAHRPAHAARSTRCSSSWPRD